jgi:hypothetical protein
MKKMGDLPEHKRTIAAHGFLSLLMKLRRVLLQDCAFLQERHPTHLLFRHDIFQSDMYKAYAERVRDRCRTVQAPMDIQFQQVMPHLHAKMDTISGVLSVGIKDIQAVLDQNLNDFRQEMQPQLSELGSIQVKQASHQRLIAQSIGLLAQGLHMITEGTFETRLRLPGEEAAGTLGSERQAETHPFSMLREVAKLNQDCFGETGGTTKKGSAAGVDGTNGPVPSVSSPSRASPLTGKPDVFMMEANHTTVEMLWKEWTEGVFGRRSIESMVESGLKKSEGQRKLYSRRKIVIDEVKRLADTRTEPEGEVVKAMDLYMSQHKLSMTKVQDLIKKRTGEGKEIAFWLDM